mmetsp:Transcript_25216/g.64064  ORF Transcript_25216/g.64064 Transcript_25216/m.64064 type:complete len:301 (+) Transcript_25216:576-1478(+)
MHIELFQRHVREMMRQGHRQRLVPLRTPVLHDGVRHRVVPHIVLPRLDPVPDQLLRLVRSRLVLQGIALDDLDGNVRVDANAKQVRIVGEVLRTIHKAHSRGLVTAHPSDGVLLLRLLAGQIQHPPEPGLGALQHRGEVRGRLLDELDVRLRELCAAPLVGAHDHAEALPLGVEDGDAELRPQRVGGLGPAVLSTQVDHLAALDGVARVRVRQSRDEAVGDLHVEILDLAVGPRAHQRRRLSLNDEAKSVERGFEEVLSPLRLRRGRVPFQRPSFGHGLFADVEDLVKVLLAVAHGHRNV